MRFKYFDFIFVFVQKKTNGVDIALIALGGLAIFAVAAAMFTDWINSFKWWLSNKFSMTRFVGHPQEFLSREKYEKIFIYNICNIVLI